MSQLKKTYATWKKEGGHKVAHRGRASHSLSHLHAQQAIPKQRAPRTMHTSHMPSTAQGAKPEGLHSHHDIHTTTHMPRRVLSVAHSWAQAVPSALTREAALTMFSLQYMHSGCAARTGLYICQTRIDTHGRTETSPQAMSPGGKARGISELQGQRKSPTRAQRGRKKETRTSPTQHLVGHLPQSPQHASPREDTVMFQHAWRPELLPHRPALSPWSEYTPSKTWTN